MTAFANGGDQIPMCRVQAAGLRAGLAVLGLCGAASAMGYEVAATYTADVLVNQSGGVATGTRYLDNIDLELKADLGELFGAGSGTLFLHGLYNNSTRFSAELVGDLQAVSNIDANEAWRVFEAWYEAGGDRWSLKAGLYDLNSEFDVNETGSLFLNSSHGIGAEIAQTGQNGPGIFPVSALALRGAVITGPGTIRVVVMDGVPGDPDDEASNAIDLGGDEGYLAVAEFDAPLGDTARLWTGYWSYSADFDLPYGQGSSDGNAGWYVGGEKRFPLGSRTAAWFLRYGQARPELNPIADYAGAGFVVDAPFAGRDGDQFGISIASAGLGDPYRDALADTGVATRGRETIWELTYRARVTEHLYLQPDIQYVENPSGLVTLDNALVLGIRFEIAY